jgi:hypothetical protein
MARRDARAMCDICGAVFPVSELRENAEGHLECPDDRGGRTALELDTQRALDASVAPIPSAPIGTADTIERTSQVVAYAWINNVDGTIRAGTHGLTCVQTGLGNFTIRSPYPYDFAEITHFDTSPHTNGNLPLYLMAGRSDEYTVYARCRNRFNGTGGITRSQFLVLLHATSGQRQMSTVLEAWVSSASPGTVLDYSSDVGATLSVESSAAGFNRLTLTGATFRFAAISQYIQGDPSTATPLFTGITPYSSTEAGVVLHLSNGNFEDGAYYVRFMR